MANKATHTGPVMADLLGRLPFAVLLVLAPFILGAIIALGPLLIMVGAVVGWVWVMNWAKRSVTTRLSEKVETEVA